MTEKREDGPITLPSGNILFPFRLVSTEKFLVDRSKPPVYAVPDSDRAQNMLLEIDTQNGSNYEYYKVNRAGWIERMAPHVMPSPQWRLLSIARHNHFGREVEGRLTDDLFAGLIPSKLCYKNGKPMWRLVWLDHGNTVISMNESILRITLRAAVEATPAK